MTVSAPFDIERLALGGGARVPVYPPLACRAVEIGNASLTDVLEVHVRPTGVEKFLGISFGYSHRLELGSYVFQPGRVAFWLEIANPSTVVLLWLP